MKDLSNLLLTLLSSGLWGMIIAGLYKYSHSRAIFPKRMQTSLIIYSVISALMLYLDFSVGGIALIGAVTLMRFRNPIKDHRDVLYVFLAVASGFACATHQFLLLAVCVVVVMVCMMVTGAFRNENRILLVVRAEATQEEELIEHIMQTSNDFLKMLYNNSTDDYTEFIYEVKNKCGDKIAWCEKFKRRLYDTKNIKEINILHQMDDIGI